MSKDKKIKKLKERVRVLRRECKDLEKIIFHALTACFGSDISREDVHEAVHTAIENVIPANGRAVRQNTKAT